MALFSNKNRKNGVGSPSITPGATTSPAQHGTPARIMPSAKTPQAPHRIAETKPASDEHLSESAIRERAHQIWLARGGGPGNELSDWFLARQELEAMEESADRGASSGGTT